VSVSEDTAAAVDYFLGTYLECAENEGCWMPLCRVAREVYEQVSRLLEVDEAAMNFSDAFASGMITGFCAGLNEAVSPWGRQN
jgi:hypothetical protein